MEVNQLRFDDHPDLSVFLVHFALRIGSVNNKIPAAIEKQKGQERLVSILRDGCIRAFPVWGAGPLPVVCFTECTKAGIESLLDRKRYEPFGLAFRKDRVFEAGGGPAFYVRGDEWKAWLDLPNKIRARATRLWPGAVVEEGEHELASYLRGKSEWAVEREWRVLGTGDPPGFRFSLRDVAFVLLHDPPGEFPDLWVEDDESELAKKLASIPRLELDADTNSIEDPAGIWLIHQRMPGATSARRVVRLLTEAARYWRFVRAALGAQGRSRDNLDEAKTRSEQRLAAIASLVAQHGSVGPGRLRQLSLERAACGCTDPLRCPHLAGLIEGALP
jgi:hypothetical protein